MSKNYQLSTLALCLSMALATACGPDETPANPNNDDACADTQVEVPSDVANPDGSIALAKGCYEKCVINADCDGGKRCRMTSLGGVCVVDNSQPNNVSPNNTTPGNNVSPNNTTPGNNVTPNNTTPGNNTTPANNTTPGNNTTPANNTTPGNNTTPANNTTPGNNTTPMDLCGNGQLDANETCDGDCPTSATLDCDDFQACTADSISGSAAMCTAVCQNDPITACVSDDGCCPMGCTAPGDNDCDAPTMDTVGTACLSDANCDPNAGGVCITEDDGSGQNAGPPGGYCTNLCNTDQDCAGDARCLVVDQNGTQICLDGCAAPGDCRTQYDCVDPGDGAGNVCLPGQEPVMGTTGTACTSDASCSMGEVCLQPEDNWAGGYCTRGCTSDAECPTSSSCHITDPQTGQGLCAADCTIDTDCRTGYACADQFSNNKNGCFPTASGAGTAGDACGVVQDCAGGQDGFCVQEDQGFSGGYCSTECTVNTDCNAGEHCTILDSGFGLCTPNCTTNTDCRAGYICDDFNTDNTNECWPGGGGVGQPGNACASVGDCAGGFDAICLSPPTQVDWAGGYCATTGCSADTDCASGSHCAFLDPLDPSVTGFCLANCTTDTDCRTGYGCSDRDQDNTNECFPTASGTGGPGAACSAVQDCAGGEDGQCLTTVDDGAGGTFDFTGGYCIQGGCATDTDCAGDGHCSFIQNGEGVCLDGCTSNNDCRTGYSCLDVEGDFSSECWPN